MSRQDDLVFGVGHQRDDSGKPIERGHGNLTDRANPKPAAQWPQDGTAHAAVFGHGAAIHPVTGKPIERGSTVPNVGVENATKEFLATHNQPDKTE